MDSRLSTDSDCHCGRRRSSPDPKKLKNYQGQIAWKCLPKLRPDSLKMHQKAFGGRASPGPAGGASALPIPSSRNEGDLFLRGSRPVVRRADRKDDPKFSQVRFISSTFMSVSECSYEMPFFFFKMQNLVIWFSGKLLNLLPPDVRF